MTEATIRDVFRQFHGCLEQVASDVAAVKASGDGRYEELRAVRSDLQGVRQAVDGAAAQAIKAARESAVTAKHGRAMAKDVRALKNEVGGLKTTLGLIANAFGLKPQAASDRPQRAHTKLNVSTVATVIAAASGAQLLLKIGWPALVALWHAAMTVH